MKNSNTKIVTIFFLFTLLSLSLKPTHSLAQAAVEESDTSSEETLPTEPMLSHQRIIINVGSQELHLIENDRLVKTYRVAVGEINHQSPLGQRYMKMITWNPWWIPPKNSVWAQDYKDTPPGETNPMGPVKMDIEDLFYIHGNNDPITIGHAVTHGCVRLINEDALELAARLVAGSAPNADKAKLDEALQTSKENYRVNLENPIVVEMVYELVEIKDDKIYVHLDVYHTGRKQIEMIQEQLISQGVEEKNIRTTLLKRDLKNFQNRRELVLNFSKYVKNFKSEKLTYSLNQKSVLKTTVAQVSLF